MNLSVTFLDVLIVLVIIVSAGYAAWRGFLSEVLTIFAWAAAAFATLYFGPWLVPLARGLISTGWLAALLAYAGVFLVVFIPLSFMSYRFSESVKHSPIGPLDRALGVAFGIIRGLVIVGLAYLAFTYFVPIRQQPGWLTEARLLPLMQSTSEVLLELLPDRDHDFAITTQPGRDDRLGALIRRQNEAANAARVRHKTAPISDTRASETRTGSTAKKGYGADDRRALDRLMETTGNSK